MPRFFRLLFLIVLSDTRKLRRSLLSREPRPAMAAAAAEEEWVFGSSSAEAWLCRRVRAVLCSTSLAVSRGAASLLVGPPGVGKSALAAAVAQRERVEVLWLDPLSLLRPDAGGCEAAVHAAARRVAQSAPCLWVLDELHTIKGRRALALAEEIQRLLLSTRVYVLGIAREADAVHPALRRGGRLSHVQTLNAPLPHVRLAILQRYAAGLIPEPADGASERMLKTIAAEAHGMCGAQLVALCQRAAIAAAARHRVERAGISVPARLADGQMRVYPNEAEWLRTLDELRGEMLTALGLEAPANDPSEAVSAEEAEAR